MCNSAFSAVNYCNPNPCGDGRCQEHMDGYICECPSGSTGNNCERRCEGEADVVFVIDNSGSIRRERYDEVYINIILYHYYMYTYFNNIYIIIF